MKMNSEIDVYERNSAKVPLNESPKIKIHSHWNYNGHGGLVLIETPEGQSYSVCARDLIKAVERCHNL